MLSKRNRIVAGLLDVLYVIETGKNSGTKTTIQATESSGGKDGKEFNKSGLATYVVGPFLR